MVQIFRNREVQNSTMKGLSDHTVLRTNKKKKSTSIYVFDSLKLPININFIGINNFNIYF